MSLSARVAVGPSRLLRAVELAVVLVGAFVFVATVSARAVAGHPVVLLLAVGLAALAVLFWPARRRPPVVVLGLGDRSGIDVMSPDGTTVRRVVDPSTTAWPGVAVVRLADPVAGAPVLDLPVVDRELPRADARALRRFLGWVAVGRSRPSDRRSSR